MNTQLVELAFILDRSGSMDSIRDQAITGFNRFLADQDLAKPLQEIVAEEQIAP